MIILKVSVEANMPPEMMKVVEDCANEFGIPMSVVEAHGPIPDDKKCFFKCIGEKGGIMNGGKPDFDALKAKMTANGAPADKIARVDTCKTISKPDPCDFAQAFVMCLKD